ncbi:MAG TPA: hypothetical protein PLF48_03550 [Chitinophagales bacterium]|nr:hypothetical protein [Chitinophagales bacterium]
MKTNKEITEELKAISPRLLQIKHDEIPLIISENYFGQLQDEVLLRISEENGKLAQLDKNQPLVPDAYFDTLGDKVMNRIATEKIEDPPLTVHKNQHDKKNKLFYSFRKLSIAACVVALLGIGIYKVVQKPEKELICIDGIACLTQDEILQYMQVHSHEFELDDVQKAVSNTLKTDSVATGKKQLNEKEEKAIDEFIRQDTYTFDELESADTDIF